MMFLIQADSLQEKFCGQIHCKMKNLRGNLRGTDINM